MLKTTKYKCNKITMEQMHKLSATTEDSFEIRESRKKFMFFGVGSLAVSFFLLYLTGALLSFTTLVGTILLCVGLLMIYKGIYAKKMASIDSAGVWTSKQGLVSWEKIESYSFEGISNSTVFCIRCSTPLDVIIIDLSMSDVNSNAIPLAIEKYSTNKAINHTGE